MDAVTIAPEETVAGLVGLVCKSVIVSVGGMGVPIGVPPGVGVKTAACSSAVAVAGVMPAAPMA